VLVVDQGDTHWRLLMMRRPRGAEFAPSAYVFPGGSVHEVDRRFGDPGRSAAVRELFEEVGILLARGRRGRFARAADAAELRELLAAGQEWPQALRTLGLSPAFDRLVFLARWITPARLARRFDTRFFLTRRPAAQEVLPQTGEVEEYLWLSPPEALDGSFTLVHATRRILESVAAEVDAARMFARLRRRRQETPPVEPRLLDLPDGRLEIVDSVPPLWARSQRQSSRQRS
jgi:8-oxo-dGTP pyrophosphatase MutT (NUDIX family)